MSLSHSERCQEILIIIMELLTKYELSCILIGSLYVYQKLVHSVCFYQIWRSKIEQREIRKVWKQI